MYRQMRFFHTKDLGFDKEQLVAVRMYDDMWKQFGAMRNDLQRNPAVAGYAVTSNLPGERFGMQGFRPLNVPYNDVAPSVRAMWADEKLLPELKVPIVEGRNFVNQFPDIREKEFILNETAAKYFGMKDPIGQQCVLDQDTGTIVGLAKDFNFASLHAKVEPLVIHYNPFRANYLLVKAHPHRLPQVLQFLDAEIKRLYPASVFSYSFVDERLERLYTSENRMMQLFRVFSIFAVFVSCLGLFGLAAYASRLRTKEVGIRKVLGASVYQVIMLLSVDFLKLVLLATLIAWPLAWWVMSRWLDGFAYRISISGWMFVASGCLALLVALVTVSFQAAKAALVDPVRSLKAD
jgi:putative ABC transport system permease protein